MLLSIVLAGVYGRTWKRKTRRSRHSGAPRRVSSSAAALTTAAAAGYSAQLTIDGAAVTENWVGGSAPSDGGSSGVDIHAYTIIKTANATFTVIANQSKTSS